MADPTLGDLLARLDALATEVATCKRGIVALARHLGVVREQAPASVAHEATDADLDASDGDPEIRHDPSPKKWSGALHKGEHMSACEAEYLDALAGFLAWSANADREKAAMLPPEEAAKKRKYAGYAERDAALARGWARRKRAQQERAEETDL